MKAYIHKCSTISVLNSLENGILTSVNKSSSRKLIEPNYKEIIPAEHLRKKSKVIRLGVASALKAMKNENAEGIIVGSGAGCCYNTVLFIGEYHGRNTRILSPNSFIQSTDNTIAGQIALILQNNSYNITYIQKGLAFENALLDAVLLSEEVQGNVLVGGVDEWIPLFELNAQTKILHPDYWIGEGASFFVLKQQEKGALAKVSACGILSANKNSLQEKVNSFLEHHHLELPDLILYGNSFPNQEPLSDNVFGVKTFNYSNLSGIYFTNSSFGTHLGVEILSNPNLAKLKGLNAQTILVINNFFDIDWGLIYLCAPLITM